MYVQFEKCLFLYQQSPDVAKFICFALVFANIADLYATAADSYSEHHFVS